MCDARTRDVQMVFSVTAGSIRSPQIQKNTLTLLQVLLSLIATSRAWSEAIASVL